MTDTTTVDLATWLTSIWDEEEAREREQTYIEFTSAFEQVNYKGNPLTLARIAADRKILELHGGGVSYPDECGLCNEPLPCETVRLLASPYKGREGWQEAWGHDER
jgi:hypothetical protein